MFACFDSNFRSRDSEREQEFSSFSSCLPTPRSAAIGWFSTAVTGAFSLICSLSGPLSLGIHASGIPLSLLMLSGRSLNCLFDPASVVMRITINNFCFVPEWLMSGVVGALRKCGGLGTSQSDVSIILFCAASPIFHRESCRLRRLA